jgi:hypothetical protein
MWEEIAGEDSYTAQLFQFCSNLLNELVAANPEFASPVRKKRELHLDALSYLVHSLIHAASLPCRYKAVGISLRKTDYHGEEQYAFLSYWPFRRVVTMLTSPAAGEPLCLLRKGTFHRTNSANRLRSRIEPNNLLKDRFARAGLISPTHPYAVVHPNVSDPVQIRLDGRNLEPVGRCLTSSETVIPLVNARLAATDFTVCYPDYRSYLDCWDFATGEFSRQFRGNQLTRQFKFDLSSGGRLYGHFVQSLPKEARKLLLMNGEPVVEYDFRSMQLHLAYDEVGHSCELADGYLIEPYGVAYREAFKNCFKRVIGTGQKKSLRSAFSFAIREELERFVSPEELNAMISAFWNTHPKLASIGNTEAWRRLQLKESEIALAVLAELEQQGIACVPLHDGFIVQQRHEAALASAMTRAVQGLTSRPTAQRCV